jgi:beta-glucosidase
VCLELCLVCPRGIHFIFSAKHFINNEQEHFRELGSSNVDARYVTTVSNLTPTNTRSCNPSTQHEIYAAPFLKSVQAGVAAVMCSYSTSLIYSQIPIQLSRDFIDRVNGIYACEQPEILNDLLKG